MIYRGSADKQKAMLITYKGVYKYPEWSLHQYCWICMLKILCSFPHKPNIMTYQSPEQIKNLQAQKINESPSYKMHIYQSNGLQAIINSLV